MKNITVKPVVLLIMFTLLAGLSSAVYADRDDRHRRDRDDRGVRQDRRDDRHDRRNPAQAEFRLDTRYQLNRRYPREGYVVRRLPERRHHIHYRDRNYFYLGGVWYQPSGASYIVTRPPIGIRVSVLPPYYTTVWFGGIPYYYANDVYYVWRPDLNIYEVAAPPVANNAPEPPVMADELYIYPKKNQSEQQQADDRYACHRWGVKETGYDPTQPPTNLSGSDLNQKREDYQRAMKACLEGRGYSVR